MTVGVDHASPNEQFENREPISAYSQSVNLPVDRVCLPFPETGMDIDAIGAYLEKSELEPA